MNTYLTSAKILAGVAMALSVAACGGGGGYGGGGGGSMSYSVGGSVSGLASGSNGVTLQDNHANSTVISANGPFTFSVTLTYGMAYNVTVLANPTSPAQTCTVTNATGTVGYSNVTNITVTCI